jgi:hypothetical protein
MKDTSAIHPFAKPAMPAVTRWIARGACDGTLGSAALVWRSMR